MKVAKSNIKFIFSLFFPFRTLPVKIFFVHKHSKVKSFLFFKLKNMKVSRVFWMNQWISSIQQLMKNMAILYP